MSANVLVQTRIDAAIKERASAILESHGMTISDAVRILLTRTAFEGGLPFDPSPNSLAYNQYIRRAVLAALQELLQLTSQNSS